MNDNPIKFEVVYGNQRIAQHQNFVRIVPSPEPPLRQRVKWFCQRNWYVPLCIIGAAVLGMYMPSALFTFAVSFVMSFLLVTLLGTLLR